MSSAAKWFIQLILPYVIDGIKSAYRAFTLKKLREKRAEAKKKRAEAYARANANNPEEVERSYEDLP